MTRLADALLNEGGYGVSATADLDEARAILRSRRIHAALCDLSCPGAAELIADIDRDQPHAAVFIFTARGPSEAEPFREHLSMNEVHLITKPFDVDDFVSTFGTALSG